MYTENSLEQFDLVDANQHTFKMMKHILFFLAALLVITSYELADEKKKHVEN